MDVWRERKTKREDTESERDKERRQAENVVCMLVSLDQASIARYDKIGLKQ